MMVDDSNDRKYLDLVPLHIQKELSRLLQSSLSFRERWEVAKAKAEAEAKCKNGYRRFLIAEGLMKKVFRKRRE